MLSYSTSSTCGGASLLWQCRPDCDYNDYMKSCTIGVREAKAQLSRLLREVARGTEWIITDRGQPVAKLVPVAGGPRSLGERVRLLESWGWIEPARTGGRRLPPPLRIRNGVAQDMLQQDRDGR